MNIFFTPDIQGNQYILSETESKHCIRVLRKTKGELLTLVDGKGGWYEAVISDPNPKRCTVDVQKKLADFEKRDYYLHIAIAPTKNNDRLEWFLEKATEIGVDEITPLLCEHSERKQVKVERLEKVIVSAMKQSLKAYLPKLNNLVTFDSFLCNVNVSRKFIAHCEESEKIHLFNTVKAKESVLILIGPEGDFSPAEIQKAAEKGYTQISLGESRLRTETAGVVATQIINLINEV
ncbi:MAG: 16S rRNA (uracil(1498)-N(3))-methyltransferase [Prolixibacteraceae bacterium]|jgi:16S rRNA (uracil1498-N3)-methyltransferase|nr:16S rRNA (uracil(1498)-N(3))-methyltransferase [Prolixibacteraceae bacterium]